MKIMFLYMFPLWGNGSGAFLRELARELVARKHKIAIVAPDKRKLKGIKHFQVKPPHMGVFVGHPELKGAKKYEEMSGVQLGRIYAKYLINTLKACQEFRPEIIHVFHTAFLPSVARITKVLYQAKLVITTHGSDLHYLQRDRRFIGPIKDACRVTKYITANSTFTRQWFVKLFGKEFSRKLRTVPGGVRLNNNSQNLSWIDKKYKLRHKKVVLFTGRLTVHKGVKYLISAARKIKGEVLILGDGPERSYLEKLIAEYELRNVHLLGYMNPADLKKFHDFYARADVYVAPSVWDEPLGLVILEAMASSTPVISTRKGGVTSIIKDGYNGYLVRSRNATQIAEKVNRLLKDDELREKMRQHARKTVEKRFAWDKITDKFERIYERTLSL